MAFYPVHILFICVYLCIHYTTKYYARLSLKYSQACSIEAGSIPLKISLFSEVHMCGWVEGGGGEVVGASGKENWKLQW